MGFDFVFLIPIVALLSVASVIIAFSPVGKALAARLGVGEIGAGGREETAALQAAMEEQAARLLMAEDEIQKLGERLEFNERLLQSRPAPAEE